MLLKLAREQGYSDDTQLAKAIQQIISACQQEQQPLKNMESELTLMIKHALKESRPELIMHALRATKAIATEITTSGELISQVCNAVCKLAKVSKMDGSKASAEVVALIKTPVDRSGKALKSALSALDSMKEYSVEDASLCEIIISALHHEDDLETLKVACSVAKTLVDTNAANKRVLVGPAGEAAIQLLNHPRCNTSLAKHSCELINSLVTKSVSNQDIMGNVSNCCTTLVSVIRTHNNMNDIDVAIRACSTVDRLARDHVRNCERLGKAGVCDVVMATFKSLSSDDEDGVMKAITVLSAICKLSKNDKNLSHFRQAKCDKVVLKWMGQFGIKHPKLAEYAFTAISLLCEHEARVKQRIVEGDACRKIVDILKEHTAETALVEFGFAALRNLCEDNSENLYAVFQLDICKLIAGALKQSTPEKNPLLAQYACWMVRHFSEKDDYERELAQNDVCSELIRVLDACNNYDVKVTVHATAALANFATEYSQAEWYSAHACTLLETLAERFSNNADVMENICRTIGNLCICLNDGDWLLDGDAYELVIRALKNQNQGTRVTSEACRALGNLLNKSKNTLNPLRDHCELVVAALRNSPNDVKLVRFACRAVQSLARTHWAVLTDLGACEAVQKAFNLKQMDKPAATYWCAALWELARDECNQVKFGEATCQNIVRLLAEFPQLGCNACGAISKLAAAPSNHRWLRGACKQVCSMLEAATTPTDKALAQAACSAIAELAKDDTENQALLLDHGACRLVVKTMNLFIHDQGVMQKGCFALWTLAENFAIDEVKQACQLVAHALRAFPMPGTLRLTTNAVHAVSIFAKTNQHAFGRLGVCALVVQVLKDCGENNAELSKIACLAIYELASLESNRKLLNDEGAAKSVELSMSWPTEHRTEAQNAIERLQGQSNINVARKRCKTG